MNRLANKKTSREHRIPSSYSILVLLQAHSALARSDNTKWLYCLGVPVRLKVQSFLPAACPALAPGGAWGGNHYHSLPPHGLCQQIQCPHMITFKSMPFLNDCECVCQALLDLQDSLCKKMKQKKFWPDHRTQALPVEVAWPKYETRHQPLSLPKWTMALSPYVIVFSDTAMMPNCHARG